MQSDTSMDDFLQSLGLEKYSITFQAEEVWKSLYFHVYCKILSLKLLAELPWINYNFETSFI